jgi:hypothetical protein
MNGLRPPKPPVSLKQRVLREAAQAQSAAPSIWSRLVESRPLRAAWGLATVALLLANVWLSLSRPVTVQEEILSVRRHLELLSDELSLPQLYVSPRAEAMVLGQANTPEVETEVENEVMQ